MSTHHVYSSIPNPPIFDRKGLFVFFPNNKSGQTSITGGSRGNNEMGALAGRCIVKKSDKRTWENYQVKDWSKAIKFTLVRHPYSRFLSTFEYLKRFYDYRSLDEFVLKMNNKGFFDPHLQAQWHSSFDASGNLLVDHILHLENIDSDWRKIIDIIRAKPIPKLNATTKKVVKLPEKYEEQVYEFYKKDFELFKFLT